MIKKTDKLQRRPKSASAGFAKSTDRSELQQIVAGLTEGVLLVEPADQSISWANDAALAMHGVKSIEGLGKNISQYREKFVLRYRNHRQVESGKYPIDRVVAGESFDEVVVVVTHKDNPDLEWVHRIRSLVITDRHGDPACLVLIMHDASKQFEAEERFERTFSANPAPAVICRLSDLRFVKVNQGFKDLTGYERDDVLGRSIYELDVLEDAANREEALRSLKVGETIPQMEACLSLPSRDKRHVLVAGQPIEMGDELCMLFTFADLQPRKQAEATSLQVEERFTKCFNLAPLPLTVVELNEFTFLSVNRAFLDMFGYVSEDVLGVDANALGLWHDVNQRKQFEGELNNAGSVRAFEAKLMTNDALELDVLLSAERITIDNGACMLCAIQDITERKRSETELIEAIETVMSDASWFSRGVVEKLAALKHPPRSGHMTPQPISDLTSREKDVLELICKGLSDTAISDELKLSRNTVRNHVAALYKKLGVNRRSGVIVWARQRGIGDGGLSKTSKRRQ